MHMALILLLRYGRFDLTAIHPQVQLRHAVARIHAAIHPYAFSGQRP